MATLKVAQNGNSQGANDPNFIHFKGEQSGVLLPPAPCYPKWMPQLQITPDGRLCFWNFPAVLYRSIVSDPVNKSGINYLRDRKTATNSNPYPPVPAVQMFTNGDKNQYVWDGCDILFNLTDEIKTYMINMEATRVYVNAVKSNSGASYSDILNDIRTRFTASFAQTPNNRLGWTMWIFIKYQIQYYINQFLNVPYDVGDPAKYSKSWITQLSEASQKGDLLGWLSAANFFIPVPPDPSTWDKVTAVLPGAILTVVGGLLTFVTAGIGTPALAAVLKQVNSLGMNQATSAINQASLQNSGSYTNYGINTDSVNSFISSVQDMPTKNKIAIAAIVLIALVILYLLFRKK